MSLFKRGRVCAYLSAGFVASIAAAVGVALASGGAVAPAAATSVGAIQPVMSCSALAAQDFVTTIPDNPTSISSATVVAATSTTPAYCDVQGTIAPQTQFEMYLPTSTWTGRYLQTGCGGYCGKVSIGVAPTNAAWPASDETLNGDFVEATDNEGHSGSSGMFAFHSQDEDREYGYESEQSMYEVAHAIIKDFYGQLPAYNYYAGGSDGGREAMEMAERYPDDFNGISAGAPEIYAATLNTEHHIWSVQANTDASGNAILTSADLPILHAAAMKVCAGDDGVNDGIVTDPEDCLPKLAQILASVQCATGASQGSPAAPTCLTAQQVNAARLLYRGPVDEHGTLLYPGGLPLGSELGWTAFVVPQASSTGAPVSESTSPAAEFMAPPYSEFMMNYDRVGPTPTQWQFTDAQYDQLYPRASIQDALSTDLSAFFAHGGKLLMWHGYADSGIPPEGTVNYYDTLVQRNGGLRNTEKSARLFMFPTVYHVNGGYADSQFATVPSLVQWVEQGVAPTSITATDTINGTTMTRPVYPYPDIPKYSGSGDPNQASSFRAVVAPAYANGTDFVKWIGNNLLWEPVGHESPYGGGWNRHGRGRSGH